MPEAARDVVSRHREPVVWQRRAVISGLSGGGVASSLQRVGEGPHRTDRCTRRRWTRRFTGSCSTRSALAQRDHERLKSAQAKRIEGLVARVAGRRAARPPDQFSYEKSQATDPMSSSAPTRTSPRTLPSTYSAEALTKANSVTEDDDPNRRTRCRCSTLYVTLGGNPASAARSHALPRAARTRRSSSAGSIWYFRRENTISLVDRVAGPLGTAEERSAALTRASDGEHVSGRDDPRPAFS